VGRGADRAREGGQLLAAADARRCAAARRRLARRPALLRGADVLRDALRRVRAV